MSQIAKHGGTCPLCGRFIKKNVSRIEKLSHERLHEDWWVPDDAFPGSRGGWEHPPQRYVHEKCHQRLIAAMRRGDPDPFAGSIQA